MPLLKGISRNLERIFRLQGAQLPIEAEVRTPLQSVQLSDDVLSLSTPPATAAGWFYAVAPAVLLENSGYSITPANCAGLWLRVDVSNDSKFFNVVPISAALLLNEARMIGFGDRAVAAPPPVGLSVLPANMFDNGVAIQAGQDIMDWLWVPVGNVFIQIRNTGVNASLIQSGQFREVPL